MGSLDYKPDLDDIRFVLFDQLALHEEFTKIEKYAAFDRDTYEAMVEEAARIATEVLAPINAVGDRQGVGFDPTTGRVTTPEGFKEAWDTVREGGWFAVSAPPEVGGVGLPLTLSMAVNELFAGAAMAFWMYPGLTSAAARVLLRHGPEGMRESYAEKMFSGEWGGTMCLTEAGAGSDVGENRCRAVPVEGEPGAYHLEGEKIFISGGDQDLTENIIHLVLARTPGSPAGTKGLSLFLVPKFLVGDDLSIGERNGVKVVGVEEKMGIHGSATCTLALGADLPCKGWLVGEEHQGIAIMFQMMNEARIGVGAQGVAICGAAYSYARRYAAERLQGTSTENFKDPEAPRVAIIEHPDVRRMLMMLKVHAEASRSFLYRIGHMADLASSDPVAHARLHRRVDLLVPILKGHCTDLAVEMASTAVQVLGGYGYIGEYPVEQLLRDARITPIYEGTNGIQALDLVGRKMRMQGGALFLEYLQDAQQECALATEAGLGSQAEAVGKALNHLAAAAMHLGQLGAQGKLDAALLQATPFLRMFGTVHLALECLAQARAAAVRAADGGETPQLRGKRLNLDFYLQNVLPGAVALGKSIQSGDESCLDPQAFA